MTWKQMLIAFLEAGKSRDEIAKVIQDEWEKAITPKRKLMQE